MCVKKKRTETEGRQTEREDEEKKARQEKSRECQYSQYGVALRP